MTTIEAHAGEHISATARRALSLALKEGVTVEFTFNDVRLRATPNKGVQDLCIEYNRACEEREAAYLASPEYAQHRREAEEKEAQRKAALDDALAAAPEHMTLRDPVAWETWRAANTDPYGGAVMTYAERWARVMEARIAAGETLEASAKASSHVADSEGITGFMYGAAVRALSECWIHGEALRRWHMEVRP